MAPPATPTATVRNSPEQYPKMLFIYPRLLGRIQVPGVAPITENTKDTQDPQHAGDPSYLGVGGFNYLSEEVYLLELIPYLNTIKTTAS